MKLEIHTEWKIMMNRGFSLVVFLGVVGIALIWKGITNNVMITPLGETVVPRWMYIFGGLVLLAFPVIWLLVTSEAGRKWLFR